MSSSRFLNFSLDFRRITTTGPILTEFDGMKTSANFSNFHYHCAFRPQLSLAELHRLQADVARSLLPIISLELEHAARSGDQLLLRRKPHDWKLLCGQWTNPIFTDNILTIHTDTCQWALCVVGYMCINCGAEICTSCAPNSPTCCSTSPLRVFSMLHTDDLRSLLSDLGDALAQDPLPEAVEQTPEYKEFHTACSAGTPLLIDCPASGSLEGWTLQRLLALFGDSACTLEDCETGQKHASTIQHFISSLLFSEEAGKPPLKLKVSLASQYGSV